MILSSVDARILVPEPTSFPSAARKADEGYNYDFVMVFGMPDESDPQKERKKFHVANLIDNLMPPYVRDVLDRLKNPCGLEYKSELNSRGCCSKNQSKLEPTSGICSSEELQPTC